METTFGELKIGQRFDYGIDADGYEPYLYKVSDTEAVIEHGQHSGSRETVAANEMVYTSGDMVTVHTHPTEVERAAITLLLHQRQDHPGLYHYIRALASDPDEMRDLDRYIWEASVPTAYNEDENGNRIPVEFTQLREICQRGGFVCWEIEWDRNQGAFSAILEHEPTGTRPTTREGRWMALFDDACARLAYAVEKYRVAGRPDGDQTTTIMGMGAPLLNVTTSLAAAIGEFYAQTINIYAGENQDLESALRSALPDDLITQTEAAQIAHITPQAINNAIRARRLRAYATLNSVAHRPGDRMVSRADVESLWPQGEQV